MSKIWLYLVKRTNPQAKITVFHGKHIDVIKEFGSSFSGVTFSELDTHKVLPYMDTRGYTAPSQDLILAMYRQFEREQQPKKYIFAEADAWILGPLDEWWKAADEKPYIGIEERVMRNGHHLINTGTYSYNSLNFLTYSKLLRQYQKDKTISIPIGEQGLTNAYFKSIGYDCTHPRVGFEYNCYAAGCIIEKLDDDSIIIKSGDFTKNRKANKLGWKWWGHRRVVKILHAFHVKFWDLPECQPLWDYCINKVK